MDLQAAKGRAGMLTGAPKAYRIFNGMFAGVFLVVLLCAVLANPATLYPVKWMWLLLCAVLGIGLGFVLARVMQALPDPGRKAGWIIAGGALALYVVLQVAIGWEIRTIPNDGWDYGAVYSRAAARVVEGAQPDLYFQIYPNNIPLYVLFCGLFGFLNLFGVTDFVVPAMALNILAIDGALVMLYFCARRLFGTKKALFVLLAAFLTLPFLLYAPIFYTDTLTLPFPIGMVMLWLRARTLWRRQDLRGVLLRYGGICLLAAAGALLKVTVLIVFIALLIDLMLMLRGRWRVRLGMLLAGGAAVALLVLGGNAAARHNPLLPEYDYDRSPPALARVMMGLQGDGGYSDADYQLMLAQESGEAAQRLAAEEIGRRLGEMGVGGFLQHLAAKLGFTYGDGTYFAAAKLDRSAHHGSWLHDWVIYTGRYFRLTAYGSFAIEAAMLFWMAFAAFKAMVTRNNALTFVRVALFGLTLFLLVWETRSRYLVNYLPLYLLCALEAAPDAPGARRRRAEPAKPPLTSGESAWPPKPRPAGEASEGWTDAIDLDWMRAAGEGGASGGRDGSGLWPEDGGRRVGFSSGATTQTLPELYDMDELERAMASDAAATADAQAQVYTGQLEIGDDGSISMVERGTSPRETAGTPAGGGAPADGGVGNGLAGQMPLDGMADDAGDMPVVQPPAYDGRWLEQHTLNITLLAEEAEAGTAGQAGARAAGFVLAAGPAGAAEGPETGGAEIVFDLNSAHRGADAELDGLHYAAREWGEAGPDRPLGAAREWDEAGPDGQPGTAREWDKAGPDRQPDTVRECNEAGPLAGEARDELGLAEAEAEHGAELPVAGPPEGEAPAEEADVPELQPPDLPETELAANPVPFAAAGPEMNGLPAALHTGHGGMAWPLAGALQGGAGDAVAAGQTEEAGEPSAGRWPLQGALLHGGTNSVREPAEGDAPEEEATDGYSAPRSGQAAGAAAQPEVLPEADIIAPKAGGLPGGRQTLEAPGPADDGPALKMPAEEAGNERHPALGAAPPEGWDQPAADGVFWDGQAWVYPQAPGGLVWNGQAWVSAQPVNGYLWNGHEWVAADDAEGLISQTDIAYPAYEQQAGLDVAIMPNEAEPGTGDDSLPAQGAADEPAGPAAPPAEDDPQVIDWAMRILQNAGVLPPEEEVATLGTADFAETVERAEQPAPASVPPAGAPSVPGTPSAWQTKRVWRASERRLDKRKTGLPEYARPEWANLNIDELLAYRSIVSKMEGAEAAEQAQAAAEQARQQAAEAAKRAEEQRPVPEPILWRRPEFDWPQTEEERQHKQVYRAPRSAAAANLFDEAATEEEKKEELFSEDFLFD